MNMKIIYITYLFIYLSMCIFVVWYSWQRPLVTNFGSRSIGMNYHKMIIFFIAQSARPKVSTLNRSYCKWLRAKFKSQTYVVVGNIVRIIILNLNAPYNHLNFYSHIRKFSWHSNKLNLSGGIFRRQPIRKSSGNQTRDLLTKRLPNSLNW